MTLESLLIRYQIHDDECNVVIVCDGAGGMPDHCVGWAAALYDRIAGRWKTLTGNQTVSTITAAELMGAWQILRWHDANLRQKNTVYHVHVFNDNESVVSVANNGVSGYKNTDLWVGYFHLANTYDSVTWHAVRKDWAFPLHAYMDQLSSSAHEYGRTMLPEFLPDIRTFLET